MPTRLIHEIFDILIFGKGRWEHHKWKDEPSQYLGKLHRRERHPYWAEFLSLENLLDERETILEDLKSRIDRGELSEGQAESEFSHDCLDKFWDELPRLHRIVQVHWLLDEILSPPARIEKRWGVNPKKGLI